MGTQSGGFGVCTWIFGNRPLPDIASRVAALGYSGVELSGELDALMASEVQQILADSGLRVMSLTPTNVDLAHPSAFVRREALDYYFHLLEFAAAVGAPLISCHGAVGRIRALSSQQQEWSYLVEGVRQVGRRAEGMGLRVGLEHLNRYESHLLNKTAEGLRFVAEVGLANVGLHLDAYHMNIEEPDPAGALRAAGERLFLFHVADSNREGVGRGHTDFSALVGALAQAGYGGPIIMECTAPGPDPFRAIKDESSLLWVEEYLRESLEVLRRLTD